MPTTQEALAVQYRPSDSRPISLGSQVHAIPGRMADISPRPGIAWTSCQVSWQILGRPRLRVDGLAGQRPGGTYDFCRGLIAARRERPGSTHGLP